MPDLSGDKLRPLLTGGSGWDVLLALPLLIHLFMGIEAVIEIGEEVRDADRTIQRGIVLAVLLTLGVYLAITATTLGLIGVAGVAVADTPLVRAAEATRLPVAVPLIMGAALLCLAKSINVNFLIFARNLFAMGRTGVLPERLARVHPRFGTPHVAATIVHGMSCLGLLRPRDLVYLFIATSVPTLLKYLSICLCAIRIALGHPDLYARARFAPPRPVVYLFAGVGGVCAVGIAGIGLITDWRPYLLVAGWGLAGIGYWCWRVRAARA